MENDEENYEDGQILLLDEEVINKSSPSSKKHVKKVKKMPVKKKSIHVKKKLKSSAEDGSRQTSSLSNSRHMQRKAPKRQGAGFVNGNGLTNGNGLINGNGLTNGNASVLPASMGNKVSHSRKRTALTIISVLIILLGTIPLIFPNGNAGPGTAADGNFHEWIDVPKYLNYGNTGKGISDIKEFAIRYEDSGLYAYLKVGAKISDTADMFSYFGFIDADRDSATGYFVKGLGADYLVEIYGWPGSLRHAYLFSYGSGSDQYNWSAWEERGPMPMAIGTGSNGSEIEVSIPSASFMNRPLSSNFVIYWVSKGADGLNKPVSVPISTEAGALSVSCEDLIDGGLIGRGSGIQILKLSLYAQHSDIGVNISPTSIGEAVISSIPSLIIKNGESKTIYLTVDTQDVDIGSFVSIGLNTAMISTDTGTISLFQCTATGYVGAAPSGIHIDGAFADWSGVKKGNDSKKDVFPYDNPNVDLIKYASVRNSAETYFYLTVTDSGAMFGGDMIPFMPSEGYSGGEIITRERIGGEDSALIYIDSTEGGERKYGIMADYLIIVKGIDGVITESSLYAYPSMTHISTVNSALGQRELEASVNTSLIAVDNNRTMNIRIVTTDWRGNFDISDMLLSMGSPQEGVRSVSGEPVPLPELPHVVVSIVSVIALGLVYRRRRS